MSEYDLVLHVGMPRSAEVLERALTRLRPQLRTRGVAFVGSPASGQVVAWGSGRRARGRRASAFVRELTAVVAEERREAAGPRGRGPVQTIVSSKRLLGEGLVGQQDAAQFRPDAGRTTAQVITGLSARKVQVVLYTQRQDRLMELAYLQRVRAGRLDAFENQFPYLFDPVLDYVDLIDRLRAVPGVADIVVRPVELVEAGQHAFVNDFLELFDLGNALDLYAIGIDPWPYPAVYSAKGARLALAINPLMDTAAERHRVQRYLWTKYRASERYDVDFLDRTTRQRILDSYAERNRELFRTHLPHLPVDSYADDSSTFALGNVLRQPVAPEQPELSARLRTAVTTTAWDTVAALERRARPIAGRARRAVSRGGQRSR